MNALYGWRQSDFRRRVEGGLCICSRYFVTVRRATRIPLPRLTDRAVAEGLLEGGLEFYHFPHVKLHHRRGIAWTQINIHGCRWAEAWIFLPRREIRSMGVVTLKVLTVILDRVTGSSSSRKGYDAIAFSMPADLVSNLEGNG